MNDTAEERSPLTLDPIQFLACVALNCLLAVFLVGAPFAMLFSHRVLPHPFSKVAAILGIALSHVVFGLPVGFLMVLMLIGLVTIDSVDRGVKVERVLLSATVAAVFGALIVLCINAQLSGVGVITYWFELADWLSSQFVSRLESSPISSAALLRIIQFQFPISMVAIVLLSVWIGIGLAAHLSWFGEDHPLSSKGLRDTTWGFWIVIGFVGSILVRFFLMGERGALIGAGFEAVFSVLLFCQGLVAISNIFAQRQLGHVARSFWYLLFSTVGFYFSVAMGVVWLISPARNRFRRRIKHESNIA